MGRKRKRHILREREGERMRGGELAFTRLIFVLEGGCKYSKNGKQN